MDTQSPDLSGKLEAVVHMLNQETAVRANADATLTGKLDALAKITATDLADTNARIDATSAIVAGLMADVAAIKQANDIAALALEVSTMRGVLEQLLSALSEQFDETDEDDGHTIEQVKAAYLAIVRHDADEVTLTHIEAADVLGDHGGEYRLINSTHDRSWTIPKSLVAELLDGEDEQ